jgi:hypothetical protein
LLLLANAELLDAIMALFYTSTAQCVCALFLRPILTFANIDLLHAFLISIKARGALVSTTSADALRMVLALLKI